MKRSSGVVLVLLFMSVLCVFPISGSAGTAVGAPGLQREARREARILTDIVPAPVAQKLIAWLSDVEAWVLSLDVGTQVLKNTDDTADSIFINGNFARLLAAVYRITGKEVDLHEALKWCDSFFVNQRLAITSAINEGGYWVDLSRNPKGNIYFGDGGTAASAL